jgi:hypothetical protein
MSAGSNGTFSDTPILCPPDSVGNDLRIYKSFTRRELVPVRQPWQTVATPGATNWPTLDAGTTLKRLGGFHSSSVQGVSFEELREGQRVSFTEGQSPKGPRAENVKLV